VLGNNLCLQAILVVAALAAASFNVVPLEMQKRIVNDAIEMRNLDRLIWCCGFYLAAVTASTALKFAIGVLQSIVARRTLCSMRQEYYRHVLTLPTAFYRDTQSGLVVSALTKDLATAGDYSGMAVSVPVTNGLLLIAFGRYLFWLNPFLAAISLSIYPSCF
jgi:ABC-type multidrug transport system fused ATPase/permease subunit